MVETTIYSVIHTKEGLELHTSAGRYVLILDKESQNLPAESWRSVVDVISKVYQIKSRFQ